MNTGLFPESKQYNQKASQKVEYWLPSDTYQEEVTAPKVQECQKHRKQSKQGDILKVKNVHSEDYYSVMLYSLGIILISILETAEILFVVESAIIDQHYYYLPNSTLISPSHESIPYSHDQEYNPNVAEFSENYNDD